MDSLPKWVAHTLFVASAHLRPHGFNTVAELIGEVAEWALSRSGWRTIFLWASAYLRPHGFDTVAELIGEVAEWALSRSEWRTLFLWRALIFDPTGLTPWLN